MDTTTFINSGIIPLLTSHIDWICVFLVLCGGFFARRYMRDWNILPLLGRDIKIGNAFKTLLMGSAFITGYLVVMYLSGELHKEDYTKYFISYCVATSLYEIIVKPFIKVLGLEKKKDQ